MVKYRGTQIVPHGTRSVKQPLNYSLGGSVSEMMRDKPREPMFTEAQLANLAGSFAPFAGSADALGEYPAFPERGVGTIEMLRQAMKMYQAKFLLPFASHFRLQHPKHEDYDLRVGKNTIIDVKQKLIEHQVIDILPGESWNSMSGNFFRVYDEQTRQKIYDGRKHFFNLDEFAKFYPEPCAVDVGELQKYLLNLNNTPEIVHCENIQVRLNGCFFYVENGKLFLGKKTKPNLEIDVPIEILQQIIVDNVSWDEAHIGYWCKMKRIGDYNQNFWRLLQSPYYLKSSRRTN